MADKSVDYVVAGLRGLATTEAKKAGAAAGRGAASFIPREEQLQRFLSGAERWRVDAGLVSPGDWARYEREMLRRVGAVKGRR